MDSSTLPCSPAKPDQSNNHPTNTTAFPLAETSKGEEKGTGRTINLDLFSPSLNCQFDLRDLAHLDGEVRTESASDLHGNFQNVSGRE